MEKTNCARSTTKGREVAQSYQGELFGEPCTILSNYVQEVNYMKIQALTDILIHEGPDCYPDFFAALNRFYAGLFLSEKEISTFCITYFDCFFPGIQKAIALLEMDEQQQGNDKTLQFTEIARKTFAKCRELQKELQRPY